MAERVERIGRGTDATEASARSRPWVKIPPGGGVDSRDYLSRLQGIFVLAQLMAESRDEDTLLRLVASSIPGLGPFQLLGIHLHDRGWCNLTGVPTPSSLPADVERQLVALGTGGGPLVPPDQGWAWAYPLRSMEELAGHLVVAADEEPTPSAHVLLGVLSQQTATSIANARLYAGQRAQADELQVTNTALAATVSALEWGTAIHDRLTQVAVAGEGEEGIARALYDLTGWPVAIEDGHGNLRAWSGPGRPDTYPEQSQPVHDELVRRARHTGRPVHEGDHLLAVASPRPDVLGAIVLSGVSAQEAEGALVALEHGATVLAMELARLHSVAETELRLGRDLGEELLANTDEEAILSRARALDYNLRRAHRVVIVVEDPPKRQSPDSMFHAVRRAARDAALGTLLVPRGDAVVVLSHTEGVWDDFEHRLMSELGKNALVGVGGICEDLHAFPRSYHEATLALRMRNAEGQGRCTLFYEQLGTYRLLAEIGELGAIDRFVEEWIGALIAYDSDHRADLVATLSSYFECKYNSEATAAALSLHRNTLKYRLRRIREISGHDLKDPVTAFNMQLATRAWATRRALDVQGHDFGPVGPPTHLVPGVTPPVQSR